MDTIIQDGLLHRETSQNYRYAKEILHSCGLGESQGVSYRLVRKFEIGVWQKKPAQIEAPSSQSKPGSEITVLSFYIGHICPILKANRHSLTIFPHFPKMDASRAR